MTSTDASTTARHARAHPHGRAQCYVQPIGLVAVEEAAAAAPQDPLRLAGGPLAFTAIRTMMRAADGNVTARVEPASAPANDAPETGPGSQSEAALLLAALRPRAPIAGLAMDQPHIMGIVNVTPDSFSDGGRLTTHEAAVAHALRLADEGAAILDIGGESTRPGAEPVSIDEELQRTIPVIEALASRTPARLSIDTRNAPVMRAALAAGAHIINDVSALTHDPEGLATAAALACPVVLMHAQGTPQTMQADPRYQDVLLDVFDALSARLTACVEAGIAREAIVVDPGIGFGKTTAHNLTLLRGLSLFHTLGVPILVGASRKGFIGQVSGVARADQRLAGSLAAALQAVSQGAQILRVHDVAQTRQALSVWRAIGDGVAGER